jgi:DNA-binding XRE family transcriptional regulator
MSREHALSMIDVLKSTINAIEQGAEKLAEVNTTKINSEKKNHKGNS